MFQPDNQAVNLASQVAMTLSAVQVRATKGSAIAVVSGMQEVLKVYGTSMDYESHKDLFDHIVEAANIALRSCQAGVARIGLTQSEENQKKAFAEIAKTPFGGKSGDVMVGFDATQKCIMLTGNGIDESFAKDLMDALNAAIAKSWMVAGEKLEKLAQ